MGQIYSRNQSCNVSVSFVHLNIKNKWEESFFENRSNRCLTYETKHTTESSTNDEEMMYKNSSDKMRDVKGKWGGMATWA